jgi:hypothetical protein
MVENGGWVESAAGRAVVMMWMKQNGKSGGDVGVGGERVKDVKVLEG